MITQNEVVNRILSHRDAEIANLERLNSEMLDRLKQSSRLLAAYARSMRDSGRDQQAEAVCEHLRRNGKTIDSAEHIRRCKAISR